MNTVNTTKTVLCWAAISLFTALSTLASAQQFTLEAVAEQIFIVAGAGANVVVHEGSSQLILVDGGNAANTEDLLAYLEGEFAGKEIATLFNTHWHPDQTGSNAQLAAVGADIIAHQNTKLWMATEIISKWNDRVYSPRSEAALPTISFFYDVQSLDWGGSKIEYGFLPQAHTDGDLYVYFPEQNVLVGGDVISGGEYPLFDYSTGGWIGGMINSLEVMLALTNATTVFIPAMGPVRNRSALEAQLALCQGLIRAITQSYYAGDTYQQFLDSAPLTEFQQQWRGNSELFLETAYESAWGHVTELRRYR